MRVTKSIAMLIFVSSMLSSGGVVFANAVYDNAMRLLDAKKYEEALAFLLPIGGRGNGDANSLLGKIYSEGLGVPKDPRMAVILWENAANAGNSSALYYLARSFELGEGTKQNYKKAMLIYKSFAETGMADAQIRLGHMYLNGKGAPTNYKTGSKWITLAAMQGNAKAQALLGSLYGAGLGVQKDNVRGYMWLNISTHNGDVEAIKGIGIFKTIMTQAQIDKAQEMSDICLASDYTDC